MVIATLLGFPPSLLTEAEEDMLKQQLNVRVEKRREIEQTKEKRDVISQPSLF